VSVSFSSFAGPAGGPANRATTGLARAGAALLLAIGLAACAQQPQDAQPAPQTQTPSAPVVQAPAEPTPPPEPPREPGDATVALLLPLTGQQGSLGQAMLNAAQMALFDVAGERFELTVHDTAGTPQGAEQALSVALSRDADLVLGPLFSTSVAAIAPRARQAGVPVVSFSNNRTVGGRGVWTIGLAPGAQVDRIVDYATRQGLNRFAALSPRNTYGDTAIAALQQAADRYGGIVAQVGTYDPFAVSDAGPVVQELARARSGYDAILIPAGGNELLGLAPLLPFYDIDPAQIQYLGTALWEDPNLGQESALVGAVFAAPDRAPWQDWSQRYRQLYGNEPPRLASLAYDATALAAVLAREAANAGQPARYEAENLTRASGFAGVDGIFRLHPDGTTERGLAILEVQRDGLGVREAAPSTFQRVGS
jgi:ABC-type branched-subunit amino acid transport system substrate-binding protein